MLFRSSGPRERGSCPRYWGVNVEAGRLEVASADAPGGRLRLVAPNLAGDAAVPTLELRAVSKRWRRKARPILDGLDLSIAPGTAALLTGRNGAGKTTLLRVASGLITPDRGGVRVKGLCPERSRREFHRRVALLSPGGSGLYARLSVRRHLDLAGRLALMARAERVAAVEQTIDDFDLRPLADDRVDRLSMGQRQRVRVAMAFLHNPQLVLLDEPSTSLDDPGVELLNSALSRLLGRGGAAIWCEPAGSRSVFSFDRRLVLEDGVLHAG
jgi:ABC-2 type transport system ATP-binding protein